MGCPASTILVAIRIEKCQIPALTATSQALKSECNALAGEAFRELADKVLPV